METTDSRTTVYSLLDKGKLFFKAVIIFVMAFFFGYLLILFVK